MMTDTWAEELLACCADCGNDGEPAGWSHLWGLHLCAVCRAKRTDTEVKVTVKGGAQRASLPPEPVLRL